MSRKEGFITLHRKIIDWEWYTDLPTFKLFIHMLLMANHTENQWRGKVIQRGSFMTSIANLSSQTGLSIQQVRTSIKRLKSTNEITSISTNRNTLITVLKYNDYQDNSDKPNKLSNKVSNKQATNKQQTNNKQITTTNNDNNDNNDNKKNNSRTFVPPTLEELTQFILENNYQVDAEIFMAHYETVGWKVGKNKMKDWRAAVRGWHGRNKKNFSPKNVVDTPSYMENKGGGLVDYEEVD